MYLHLGQDYIVPLQSVVAVFDMDTATASKRTRLLLERLQDEGRIIELYDDLPRAAVLCEKFLGETLYLTQLSPQAIQRRAEKDICIITVAVAAGMTYFFDGNQRFPSRERTALHADAFTASKSSDTRNFSPHLYKKCDTYSHFL